LHTINTTQSETELSVIKKIMEDSRNIIADNGWHYIFWGIVVTCALLANYFMILARISDQYYGMLWFFTMTFAWITEVIIEKRIRRKRREKTFAGKLISSLWTVSGISMFIYGFAGTVSGAYHPSFISPIISTMLGVTYIISGAIQQAKWLQLLSIGWWGGAVYLFLFPSINTLLIFAIMMLCLQVLPGIILHSKWKRNPAIAE
jgi:MFS family permease